MLKAEPWTNTAVGTKAQLRQEIRRRRFARRRSGVDPKEPIQLLNAWQQALDALVPPSDQHFAALFKPTPFEPDISEIIRYETQKFHTLFPVLVDAQGVSLVEPAWAVASSQTRWEQPNPLWPPQPRVQIDAPFHADLRQAEIDKRCVTGTGTDSSTTSAGSAAASDETAFEQWLAPRRSSVLSSHALAQACIVVVAALGVAPDGTRLGQGGGWYDRALPYVQAPIVAACFNDELFAHLTAEKHDVPVDGVITPSGFFPCKR